MEHIAEAQYLGFFKNKLDIDGVECCRNFASSRKDVVPFRSHVYSMHVLMYVGRKKDFRLGLYILITSGISCI